MKNELRWKVAQAAEIRWWQNYLNKKPKEDYLEWKRKYWNKLLKEIDLKLSKNEQVLDAGCGPAGIFMVMNEQKVDALDPLLDSYEAQLKHFKKGDYPLVNFHNTPLELFDCQPNKYDKVFCLNAINHVADLDLCFSKLVEITKPGGCLIVSIDAHNYTLFKHIFKLIPGDILHPHQYDLGEYQAMLKNKNCSIEKTLLYKKEFFFNYFILVARRD